VHLLGVGLLFTFALSVMIVLFLNKPSSDKGMFAPMELLLEDSLAMRDDLRALQARVDTLHARMDISTAFYTRDGTVLARAGAPIPPLPPDELEALERSPTHTSHQIPSLSVGTMRSGRLESYGVLTPPRPNVSLSLAFVVVLVFGFLALLSVPFARSVVKPIEELAQVTRRFGAGDLGARAGESTVAEVGALALAFNEMADRIDATRRIERELLANVSHELRTPLSRIRVVLDLAGTNDPGSIQRYLADIGEDLAEVDALIEAVLTAARLDAGVMVAPYTPHQPVPIDLMALADDAAQRVRSEHADRVLRIAAPSSSAVVAGDWSLLRRALENILSNALKYSDAAEPIDLVVERCGDSAAFRIRDHGIGISNEDLGHLFTPFFRVDRSRTRTTGGVGLGLLIARRIVEAHGGHIDVESVLGEGTTVSIVLPAAVTIGGME
jgi:signal transduction histidine kinase